MDIMLANYARWSTFLPPQWSTIPPPLTLRGRNEISDASTDNGIVDPGVAGTCCDQEHQLLLELVALSEVGSLIV